MGWVRLVSIGGWPAARGHMGMAHSGLLPYRWRVFCSNAVGVVERDALGGEISQNKRRQI